MTKVSGRTIEGIENIIQLNPEVVVVDIDRPCKFYEDLSEAYINEQV